MLTQLFWLAMLIKLLHNRLCPSRIVFMPQGHLSSNRGNELGEAQTHKEVIERTITEEDVNLFSKVTGDFNAVHSSRGDNPGIVHGALLNGIVSGIIGTKLPGSGTIVLSQTLNFPKPCFVGETVIVTVEIEKLRKISVCNYEVISKLSKSVVMNGSAKLLLKGDKTL